MEIKAEGVRVPSANKFKLVCINPSAEECHGTTSPKGSGADDACGDTCGTEASGSCKSELVCNFSRLHAVGHVITVESGQFRSRVKGWVPCKESTVPLNDSNCDFDRAAQRVATSSVSDGVTFALVFLCCEIELH